MHSVRHLDGATIEEMLYPKFRIVNFDDEPAIRTVATSLRDAWPILPGEPAEEGADASALGAFLRAHRTVSERQQAPRNPDKDTVRTPWRDEIYHMWNHVFWDVGRFLAEVGPGIGEFHPPAHEVFVVDYPSSAGGDGKGMAVRKVWDTNVLLLPAYLEPGIRVRFSSGGVERQDGMVEKVLGTFDGENTAEIWFVMAGLEVNIYVEGEYEGGRKGVAAVLVYGKLCTQDHEEGHKASEEGIPSTGQVEDVKEDGVT